MQRISSFSDEKASEVQAVLGAFNKPSEGVEASAFLMPQGWFARFVWPDWPKQLADDIAVKISEFHHSRPELRPVEAGSREWLSVSHSWESDYDSAEAIGLRFNKHFDGKVAWVESQKDRKGRIAGECSVEGVGKFLFDLLWQSSLIHPSGSLKAEHYGAFRQAAREVMEWASRRIQPILDVLNQKLQELYGDRFRGLYVFGSYARPDAGIDLGIDSDLDVALLLSEFDNRYDERARIGDIVASLSLEHDIVISLIPIREQDFKEGNTNFTRVISEYAIPVK